MKILTFPILFFSILFSCSPLLAEVPPIEQAQNLEASGKYADALKIYTEILNSKNAQEQHAAKALESACDMLTHLGRIKESDSLIEESVIKFPDSWQVLHAAAKRYLTLPHFGNQINNQFERGAQRNVGKTLFSEDHDRIRALQLLEQAMPLALKKAEKQELASFYLTMAEILSRNFTNYEGWKLQILSDTSTLPELEESQSYRFDLVKAASVDKEGNPITWAIPAAYEKSKNDGERLRWLMAQITNLDKSEDAAVKFKFASFLKGLFHVSTLADWNGYAPGKTTSATLAEVLTFESLKDDETIALLANGTKRFSVPIELNFISIFKDLSNSNEASQRSEAEMATDELARIFQDRRQFEKAAEYWRIAIKRFGAGSNEYRQKALDQIVKPWVVIESTPPHAPGTELKLEIKFRNSKNISFEAYAINLEALLDETKSYLKSSPRSLDWQKLQFPNLSLEQLDASSAKWHGEKVATWSEVVTSNSKHFDSTKEVLTPLKEAGTYLVQARSEGGNTSNIIVWLNPAVIVRKNSNASTLFYVADAATGKATPNATLTFFGYRQRERANSGTLTNLVRGLYETVTSEFSRTTDKDGQVLISNTDLKDNFQWNVSASQDSKILGVLGFQNLWSYQQNNQDPSTTLKSFIITDRPIYRPGQSVKIKGWLKYAGYGESRSKVEPGAMTLEIRNPRGEKEFEKSVTLDAEGAFESEVTLSATAGLGQYFIVPPRNSQGGLRFRVEEYKKPEFEVSIDSPSMPLVLGDKTELTVKAKYYFGQAVSNAKVHYKILRYSETESWFPIMAWDWLYGNGYWWQSYNYDWLPGWRFWGCLSPHPWWWSRYPGQPEMVANADGILEQDGTFKIPLDTEMAKALHADSDHRYEIQVEVTDQSRRTIDASSTIIVTRSRFKIYAWVNRGYYQAGDHVVADFSAQTADHKPISGVGALTLFKLSYKNNAVQETEVQKWQTEFSAEGKASQKLSAATPGQYRLSMRLKDAVGHEVEGGYVFTVRGEKNESTDYRFSKIELISDKREYKPGDKVQLLVNTEGDDSEVLLFVRPLQQTYPLPIHLRLKGKSAVYEIPVTISDAPNFFVEALTIRDGRVHTESKQIFVPPQSKVLNVSITPQDPTMKPGAETKVSVHVTDQSGNPVSASLALSVYDKSIEYISGGPNVPEMRAFFWKWSRNFYPHTIATSDFVSVALARSRDEVMSAIGAFGQVDMELALADDMAPQFAPAPGGAMRALSSGVEGAPMQTLGGAAPRKALKQALEAMDSDMAPQALVAPSIRKDFSDSAVWVANISTDVQGNTEIPFKIPESLTTWKIRTWAMGKNVDVGQAENELITTKNVLVRLQAPRFFVEKDEVVISVNVHNFLKEKKNIEARLELGNDSLLLTSDSSQHAEIAASSEHRFDWKVKALKSGEALIRALALSDSESDAMEMHFPVKIHGIQKTDAYLGSLGSEKNSGSLTLKVPDALIPEKTELQIRYSPSLALAMVDALPYLADFPYGCTEQTLSRFLPSVLVQRSLKDLGINLSEIKVKHTNLNSQEIGNSSTRAAQWKRYEHNPVFDEAKLNEMVHAGVARLAAMQVSDGGWGWFSGYGEQSYPHTTAYVVHGLLIAKNAGVTLPTGMLDRGVAWLKQYQSKELAKIRRAKTNSSDAKTNADDLDAFVAMVLSDAGVKGLEMQQFLFRDRGHLSVYALTMLALSYESLGVKDHSVELRHTIDQYLVEDTENETAYLRLPSQNYWWYWYGSEIETLSYYLKLLARTEPKGELAPKIAKYLLNNRKNATYWNSTRDTSLALEALSEFLVNSGEQKPDYSLDVLLDGKSIKQVKINQNNLFDFDDRVVLTGREVTPGAHTLEFRKQGQGKLYYNAYLSYFSLEDPITKAGLELKVNRKMYLLTQKASDQKVQDSNGQVVNQKAERFERSEIDTSTKLKSGDLVEIELSVDSKNDYEYLLLEDQKPAGFEPLTLQSGYDGNAFNAYTEYRDDRVALFVRALPRGTHSVSYRMRAEIPGKFSALPTKVQAMYAPELVGNSDENRVLIGE